MVGREATGVRTARLALRMKASPRLFRHDTRTTSIITSGWAGWGPESRSQIIPIDLRHPRLLQPILKDLAPPPLLRNIPAVVRLRVIFMIDRVGARAMSRLHRGHGFLQILG